MILTSLTRMWLTRSIKPFIFKSEYDNQLSYSDCSSLGLYVHIPFCRQLCTFCPYCKELYTEEKCNKYVEYLIREIHMIGRKYDSKKCVTSLYFGGGTPALAARQLKKIIEAVNDHYIITDGIGVELHPDNVCTETLLILKEAGVTKISIGIQSFQDKFLSVLGRKRFDCSKMTEALNEVKFETVSMDFIFALPDQTVGDLKADIEKAFKSGANHIAIYPFIDFSFTDSTVHAMTKKEKKKLLDDITNYCIRKGYRRDSIWTFSNDDTAKYSSMTRDNFLGFGCSATTLLKSQFKINTFSVEEYQKRIDNSQLPTSLTLRFSLRQRMVYYLFWTAYSTQVDPDAFKNFFGVPLRRMYGLEIWLAWKLKFIDKKDEKYQMTLKGAFYYHYYENYYTLSYIDKMWRIMRKEAFPDKLCLK